MMCLTNFYCVSVDIFIRQCLSCTHTNQIKHGAYFFDHQHANVITILLQPWVGMDENVFTDQLRFIFIDVQLVSSYEVFIVL